MRPFLENRETKLASGKLFGDTLMRCAPKCVGFNACNGVVHGVPSEGEVEGGVLGSFQEKVAGDAPFMLLFHLACRLACKLLDSLRYRLVTVGF